MRSGYDLLVVFFDFRGVLDLLFVVLLDLGLAVFDQPVHRVEGFEHGQPRADVVADELVLPQQQLLRVHVDRHFLELGLLDVLQRLLRDQVHQVLLDELVVFRVREHFAQGVEVRYVLVDEAFEALLSLLQRGGRLEDFELLLDLVDDHDF